MCQCSGKTDNFDFFGPNLPKNKFWGPNFKKQKKSRFEINTSKFSYVPIFSQNKQL